METLVEQTGLQLVYLSLIKRTLQTRRVLTFLSMCLRVVSATLVLPLLNELPCPICDNWYSKTNFSRHAKNHNITTQELLEGNKKRVLQMIDERKKGS